MKSTLWKLETIAEILPEEFYGLILRNKDHIAKGFPATLSNCSDEHKTRAFIAKNTETENNKEGYYFYLRDLQTGSLIGYICIKSINNNILKCELAYFIDQAFEGHGIMSGAVSQVIDFCFKNLMMNKVFICTSEQNTASQRIALNKGFIREGVLRQEFKNSSGILEDIVYFGLLKQDHFHEK